MTPSTGTTSAPHAHQCKHKLLQKARSGLLTPAQALGELETALDALDPPVDPSTLAAAQEAAGRFRARMAELAKYEVCPTELIRLYLRTKMN